MIERSFHAFCVGAAKSGTHSLAAMVEHHHRSAHEPRPREAFVLGELARSGLGRQLGPWLRRRDRLLGLELESSHLLGPLTPRLAAVFPNALFILPVRDPRSWLRSILVHRRSRPPVDTWARWWHWLRFEHPPRPTSVAPLTRYLRYWRDHNLRVVRSVPSDRLLVLPVHDLDRSAARIAAFLGIDEATVTARHEFRALDGADPLASIDRALLDSLIDRFADPLLLRIVEPEPGAPGRPR